MEHLEIDISQNTIHQSSSDGGKIILSENTYYLKHIYNKTTNTEIKWMWWFE